MIIHIGMLRKQEKYENCMLGFRKTEISIIIEEEYGNVTVFSFSEES